eukprot:Hpha_TRINITY_DN16231_c0_g5::TRINITY_DN16231_c0_g5_i2::g.13214::m.13214
MPAMEQVIVQDAVPLKFSLVRCGKLTQTRRVTLLRPTLANLTDLVQGWANGSFELQYTDEDGDKVQLGSEAEWLECLRLWREGSITGPNALRLSCVVGRCASSERPRVTKPQPQPFSVEAMSYRRRGDGTHEAGMDRGQQALVQATTSVMEALLGPGALQRISAGAIGPAELVTRFDWITASGEGAGVDLDFNISRLVGEVNSRAHGAFDMGEFEAAAHWFQLLSELMPGESGPLYNLACARARLGQTAGALEALDTAIVLGFNNVGHLAEDEDLENVRAERPAEWDALMQRAGMSAVGLPKEPSSDSSSWYDVSEVVPAAEPTSEPEQQTAEPSAVLKDDEPEPAAVVPAEAVPPAPKAQELVAEVPTPETSAPAADELRDWRREAYGEQLGMLRDMGLVEDEIGLTFLESFGGNLQRVVEELFGQ